MTNSLPKVIQGGRIVDSIELRNQEQLEFPLTYPQRGVWYLEKINPQTGIGNIAVTLKLEQILDYDLVSEAINLLLQQNEGIRIRIRENQDGTAVQYFAPYESCQIDYYDFRETGKAGLFKWDQIESHRPFVSFDQNLFYFALIRIDEQTSGVFMRFHHLITDAWSFVQLGNELMSHYDTLSLGREIESVVNPSYRDFIASEQQYIQSDRYQVDRDFWRNQFKTPPTPTTLKTHPVDRVGYGAKRRSYMIPEKLTQQIRDYCQENRTSIFALFFAAMSIYINRIKDQEDITIGTPVLNRTNAREKKTVGMFISTVPLRVRINSELTFSEFSHELDQAWFSVLKHQKYPYDCLLRDVRDLHPGVEQLYEIAISYQRGQIIRGETGVGRDAEARWHFTEYQSEALFLHINDREGDSHILLNYDYLTDLFYAREIEFIHDHVVRLLWHAIDNPQRKISQIHMLSEKEHHKVIETFNQTDAEYPRTATIGGLFETVVDNHPDAVALEIGKTKLTYQALDQIAEVIANHLRQSGLKRETIVALLVTPSVTMIAAILGVIKAGGAYLPIDPDYPQDRISYMLQDSGAQIVLAAANKTCPVDYDGEVVDVTAIVSQALRTFKQGVRLDRQPCVSHPTDLLYVIYTSGSTGRPKGAMIEHRNVVRLLFNSRSPFDFGPQDTWTMFHSYCFDFSVWEIYGALLNGSRLILVPRTIARDPLRFRQLLVDRKVTILNQTPAAFYNLADTETRFQQHDLSLRMIIFGGDALKPALLRHFHRTYPEIRLINMYGITETTVHVTCLEMADADLQSKVSNIGRPIPTMRVYILDNHLNPVPIGASGELCVSGEGVGRGYLNNPELTSKRFIPNPFVLGETLYRSGDLARFFALGDIEYLGRIDHQVKIRGHRIELGEIESVILGFGRIREVRVLTRDQEGGSKQLIAYFVASEAFELEELRAFLVRSLPDYMIPHYLVAIDNMPLNSNGKIARDKLPEVDTSLERKTEFIAPLNELQHMIAEVFAEVLELPAVSINDHFFHLGGDSLSAVRVVASLGESVSFADLYTHPTVSELADFMDRKNIEGCRLGYLLPLATQKTNHHLVFFPFGGGSAASYLKLSQQIKAKTDLFDVYAVNLPDVRLDQANMAARLAKEIRDTLTGDLYFYSHCAGSSLALETANILQVEGWPINSMFIGASLPPWMPQGAPSGNSVPIGRKLMRSISQKTQDPWRYLSDSMVLRVLKWIGLPQLTINNESWLEMLKIFRTDARQFYAYFNRRMSSQADSPESSPLTNPLTSQLTCPIHCMIGEHDPITHGAARKYKSWQPFARSVDLTVMPGGGHYFLSEQADLLAEKMIAALQKDMGGRQ
jgi:bacitracin synthase 3